MSVAPVLLKICETNSTEFVMPVTVTVAHWGDVELAREVQAAIEHVLANYPGEWRVSVVGSQANDRWELKVFGPNLFERSYTLEGAAGEHRPETVRTILGQILPKRSA